MGNQKDIAVVGAGAAGLMAAQVLARAGCRVTVFDHLPSPGRKLLMAGRGGLNLTHSEPLEDFLPRYGAAQEWLAPYIQAFTPQHLRAWCEELGEPTFTGSSGRVFPRSMKAAPLLRAWLRRLDALGVTGTTGLARAISSAGGICREAVDEKLMLREKPGVFVAGEMLDWEAPTGGYLLQACFATAVAAARGAVTYLEAR